MASRRSIARLAERAGACLQRRAITTAQQPSLIIAAAAVRRHASMTATRASLLGFSSVGGRRVSAAAPTTTKRAYSQQVAEGQSKIWDFEQIQKLIKDPKSSSVIIVDTREPGELKETGRIPGAVNISVKSAPDSYHISDEEFEDAFGYPRPAKDAEVVFYCKAGVRSRAAASLARDAGYTNVGEYPGSWLDWVERGGKVER
ncbi:Rhodanese-like domain-containing protein [Bombardia bombarda]|uniref:Rhodanese-like domain-containing protein n=1 Tax=Bombardia bombarda TaxID=252184 RepID=A0AA39X9I2_9PEZI|nr:Rhodanese-like domain-containing protein [Bombardia bombarda]